MRWPMNGCDISAPRNDKKKLSMKEKSSVPRPVNWCHTSGPAGSEVYKKKIMKQNLQRCGQLIGCIYRFHSNKKQVVNGEKILGASDGQLVPCLGADRLRLVPRCTQKIDHEGKSPAPWPINRQQAAYLGSQVTKNKWSMEEKSSVPRPVNWCHISAPIGPEVSKKNKS